LVIYRLKTDTVKYLWVRSMSEAFVAGANSLSIFL
jgi:hypothetical protein